MVQRLSRRRARATMRATILRIFKSIESFLPWHQRLKECPISTDCSASPQRPLKMLSRMCDTAPGSSAEWAALRHVMSRSLLEDSGTESDEKVRYKNPSRACRSFVPTGEGRGAVTSFELQKPGIVLKNASSA